MTEVGIGSPVWTSDSKGVVFTEVNENWRSYRARLPPARPAARRATSRSTRRTTISASRSASSQSQDRSLIFIATGDNATSEVRFVPADNPTAPPMLIAPRQTDREYAVDAAHGKLWILTNDDHVNFRLAEADRRERRATGRR